MADCASDYLLGHYASQHLLRHGCSFVVSVYPHGDGVRYTGPVDRRRKPRSSVLYRIRVKPKGKSREAQAFG